MRRPYGQVPGLPALAHLGKHRYIDVVQQGVVIADAQVSVKFPNDGQELDSSIIAPHPPPSPLGQGTSPELRPHFARAVHSTSRDDDDHDDGGGGKGKGRHPSWPRSLVNGGGKGGGLIYIEGGLCSVSSLGSRISRNLRRVWHPKGHVPRHLADVGPSPSPREVHFCSIFKELGRVFALRYLGRAVGPLLPP